MTTPAPPLSVCIPTYNRAALLRRSLEGLIAQVRADGLEDRVQLCVSDNASPDDTAAVVAGLRQAHPGVNLAYRRNEANLDFARNVIKVVELAAGAFVALTGDDDEIAPGGLRAMLDAAGRGEDLILFNTLPGTGAWLKGLPPDDGTECRLADAHAVNERLGVFHASFLGNLVVRRAAFLKHVRPEHLSCPYAHTAVALSVLRDGPARFVNRATFRVDDSDRGWRYLQPRLTCLDMARVQTAEVLRHGATAAQRAAVYRVLVRSVPRAVMVARGVGGPWRGDVAVPLSKTLAAYGASRRYQAVAAGLWLAARCLPGAALRRVLAWQTRRRPAPAAGEPPRTCAPSGLT